MEVHNNPSKAKSDPNTVLDLKYLERILIMAKKMHEERIKLVKKFNNLNWKTDMIIVSDMLDLTIFLALTRKKTSHIPTSIYFHENQLSYPWSINDRYLQKKRDRQYGFINISSALAADHVLFNSNYHYKSFQNEGLKFLKNFPDRNELDVMQKIQRKSEVLYLGMDLSKFDKLQNKIINKMGQNEFYTFALQKDTHILQAGLRAENSVDSQIGFHEDFLKAVEIVNDSFYSSLIAQKDLFKGNSEQCS